MKNSILTNCSTCGKEMEIRSYWKRKNNFCNKECYDKFHKVKRIEKVCKYCGKTFFTREKYKTIYCSRKCYRLDYNGKNFDSRHKKGFFFSKKNYRLNWFDSSWELKRMKELDLDSSINMWNRSKLKIPYINTNGKNKLHNPDFLIENKDGTLYIEEVKGYINENTLLKIRAAKDWCDKNNLKYRIIGEKEILDSKSPEILMDNYSNSYGFFWRPSFVYIWMKSATLMSERSTCLRHKVGCVITPKSFRYNYSFGYNGSLAGEENGCKSLNPGECGCIHAEVNALNKIDELNIQMEESIMFITLSPCKDCAERILKYPMIRKVIYLENYRSSRGRDILIENGIEVVKYSDLINEQNQINFSSKH